MLETLPQFLPVLGSFEPMDCISVRKDSSLAREWLAEGFLFHFNQSLEVTSGDELQPDWRCCIPWQAATLCSGSIDERP